MSTVRGRFRPPPQKISITDGQSQVQFDTPAEMVEFFRTHLDFYERLERFVWTTQEISGEH